MKRAEAKTLVNALAADLHACVFDTNTDADLKEEIRTALATAFVAGVRSGLKYTSDAQFAALFDVKEDE